MKRIILSLVVAVAMGLGFGSCQHQTMESAEVIVRSGDWSRPMGVNYWVYDVSWDALTAEVVDLGTVNAYLIEGGRQNMLPYVYPVDYSTYDTDGNLVGDPVYIAENLRFDYTYGKLTFIMQDLDNDVPTGEFPDMHFRIVAIGD